MIATDIQRSKREKPGRHQPEKTPARAQRFYAYDVSGLEIWERQQRENKAQPLFLDARNWQDLKALELHQSQRRKEISSIKNDARRMDERRLWTIVEDKLRRCRAKLAREIGPRPQESIKPFRAHNETELRTWLREQRQAITRGETDLRKLVLVATTEDGIGKLQEIMETLKNQYENLPKGKKKEQERLIYKKFQEAFNSARWFVNKQKGLRSQKTQSR